LVSRQWPELIRDVEDALGKDPAGEKGQALAARWIGLVEEFTAGSGDRQRPEETLCGPRELAEPGPAADAAVPHQPGGMQVH